MRAPVGHFERRKEDLNGRVHRLGGLLLILPTSHIRQCIALVEVAAVHGVWKGVVCLVVGVLVLLLVSYFCVGVVCCGGRGQRLRCMCAHIVQ